MYLHVENVKDKADCTPCRTCDGRNHECQSYVGIDMSKKKRTVVTIKKKKKSS